MNYAEEESNFVGKDNFETLRQLFNLLVLFNEIFSYKKFSAVLRFLR